MSDAADPARAAPIAAGEPDPAPRRASRAAAKPAKAARKTRATTAPAETREERAARLAEARAAKAAKVKAADEATIINVRPMAAPARFQLRHKGLMLAFALIVLLPVALATWYMNARAADQYASTLAFTVRSEEMASATDILGGVGAALGGGGSARDSDILYEFIRSQEMVAAVDARLDLAGIYARHTASDPVFGFVEGGTIEDLSSYWRRMVRIAYDSSTGLMELRVLAFDPQEARAIAAAIQEESLAMINNLSAIAREDAIRYATGDLDLALERLKTAREAITAFRLENRIVDVNADIQGQMGLLNTLQGQLASALIEFDLLRNSAREGDPRLDQAQTRIDVIEARIADERAKFGGGGASNYAITVAEFERLTVEREFAEASYLASLQAFDLARAEADRQSRYLAIYIRPTLAQSAEFPQSLLIIGLVALFAFLIWAILSLVFYALRDRR